MTPLEVLEIGQHALWITLKVGMPIMITALGVGLVISLIQALTQIQEVTLTFVPKIIAVFVVMMISLSFMGQEMNKLAQDLATRIAGG